MLLDFKHGQLLNAELTSTDTASSSDRDQTSLCALQGRKLYDSEWNWNEIINRLQAGDNGPNSSRAQAKWLQQILPGCHNV